MATISSPSERELFADETLARGNTCWVCDCEVGVGASFFYRDCMCMICPLCYYNHEELCMNCNKIECRGYVVTPDPHDEYTMEEYPDSDDEFMANLENIDPNLL